MKAYFTASIAGKETYLRNYLKIIDTLKKKGTQTLSDHIMNATESKIRLETKDDRIKFHKQLQQWISSADFIVVETSFPSISVGYEISLAMQLGKPILILYSEGDAPSLLAHHKNENLVCEKYTLDTLNDIIDDFLNYIQGTADTRFTFFITSQIALFLDNISRDEKMPKSVYLRKLIEKDMSNHQ